MVRKSLFAALGFIGLMAAGTAGGSAPAQAHGCGPWNNWCAPRCGPWNNWCRPVCGPWNGWCAYFRPGYGYGFGYGGKGYWGGHGGGAYAYRQGRGDWDGPKGNWGGPKGDWDGHHGDHPNEGNDWKQNGRRIFRLVVPREEWPLTGESSFPSVGSPSQASRRPPCARNGAACPASNGRCGCRRSGRRARLLPPSPERRGGCGRACPGVPRNCGWRSRRSAHGG